MDFALMLILNLKLSHTIDGARIESNFLKFSLKLYKVEVGARGGASSSITIKHFNSVLSFSPLLHPCNKEEEVIHMRMRSNIIIIKWKQCLSLPPLPSKLWSQSFWSLHILFPIHLIHPNERWLADHDHHSTPSNDEGQLINQVYWSWVLSSKWESGMGGEEGRK